MTRCDPSENSSPAAQQHSYSTAALIQHSSTPTAQQHSYSTAALLQLQHICVLRCHCVCHFFPFLRSTSRYPSRLAF
jgi:hypothetical protein